MHANVFWKCGTINTDILLILSAINGYGQLICHVTYQPETHIGIYNNNSNNMLIILSPAWREVWLFPLATDGNTYLFLLLIEIVNNDTDEEVQSKEGPKNDECDKVQVHQYVILISGLQFYLKVKANTKTRHNIQEREMKTWISNWSEYTWETGER